MNSNKVLKPEPVKVLKILCLLFPQIKYPALLFFFLNIKIHTLLTYSRLSYNLIQFFISEHIFYKLNKVREI